MAELEFVFPEARRLEEWAERHDRGEVPGRWPYGLEALDDPPGSVSLRGIPSPTRLKRLIARLPLPTGKRLGATWDEQTAHRMMASRRYDRMYTGIIWATDRSAALAASQRRVLERMTGVWVLSAGQLDRLEDLLPPDVERRHVLFGVDTLFFTPAPYPSRQFIFSVGGDRDRDPATTAEAFRLVLNARPHVEAAIQTPQALSMDPRIRVLKHLTHLELREMYARASVVAIATRPNLHVSGMTVSLESMATARPVVLTGSPGMKDYVSDGTTGLIVECGQPHELADRIIDLLDNPKDAERMGLQARAMVESKFTVVRLADQLRRFMQLAPL